MDETDGPDSTAGGSAGGVDPRFPSSRVGSVEFGGAFEPGEREYLGAQFGRCRFELLARSAREPRLLLVLWQVAQPRPAGGPSPLFSPPARAVYVLDRSESHGPDGASTTSPVSTASASATSPDAQARPEPALVRIDSEVDLENRYPGHFAGVQLGTHLHRPWWQRVGRALRGAVPGPPGAWIMLGLAIWVASLLQAWPARG